MTSMDMSSMDMGDMGGMDMGSAGLFRVTNMAIAHSYWYIIAATVGFLGFLRLLHQALTHVAVRSIRRDPTAIPSRPRNPLAQAFATATAVCREISYPQPWLLTGSFGKYFNPPSLGRCCVLVLYWIMVLTMLWSNVILKPDSSLYAYKWEIVGFRAAWVSVTQLPLIYCLSCKINIISIITGVSYERFNWLHRWSARTIFLTLIVHWSFFYREWALADFVKLEMSMMPIVKYGFGAWAVIGWMVLSGFGYFRSACYEIWVLQHLASSAVLLWLVFVHIPSYARYNVWLAIGFVAFDWSGRALLGIVRNIHCWSWRRVDSRRLSFGYEAKIEAVTGDVTKVTIGNVGFSWKPGQHVYITLPMLGFAETHPFTIANVACRDSKSRSLDLYVKARSGFSAKLYKAAKASGEVSGRPMRALISGPWGSPPTVERFETLIFVCTSIGATFNVPLLQAASCDAICVRRLLFHWILRDPAQIDCFSSQISSAIRTAHQRGIAATVKIWITEQQHPLGSLSKANSGLTLSSTSEKNAEHATPQRTQSSPSSSSTTISTRLLPLRAYDGQSAGSLRDLISHPNVDLAAVGRPSIETMIRPAVEEAMGETGIFLCGGFAISAEVRSYVALLSDERAVYKGTGAQGISLFTENFGW